MRKVGSRELKNRLGRYLAIVKKGGEILITDRKRVVAKLVPATDGDAKPSLDDVLKRLAAEGHLRLGTGEPLPPFKPIRVKGKPVSRTIIEDRR